MDSASDILTLPDEKILEIGHQLRVAYKLKTTLRYWGSRDLSVHGESVAEHVFALLYLAQYFLPLEDVAGKLDKARVYEILLFHDFGEIINGDIPYHFKTPADEAREIKDAESVFESLPKPLGEFGRSRWEEYEHRETPEGRFVYALDKIEPVFELLDPITEKTMRRTKVTFAMHIGKKIKATEGYPVMRRFVDVLGDDMNRRGIFWSEGEM